MLIIKMFVIFFPTFYDFYFGGEAGENKKYIKEYL